MSKAGQKNLINRLYRLDGETKKQKYEFYEEEKARREKESCTFAPNKGLGLSKHISVKLFSDKDGMLVDDNTRIDT
jgi:hypothetical protein